MSFTFEQMMQGEGLPEENVRFAAISSTTITQKIMRKNALGVFRDRYGKDADVVVQAEKDGEFVCMAYRADP